MSVVRKGTGEPALRIDPPTSRSYAGAEIAPATGRGCGEVVAA